MARAKRPPKPPVSDRALHLWLSAVLGIVLGVAQSRFGLITMDPWTRWAVACVCLAVVISMPIVAAHPRFLDRLSIAGVVIAVVVAGLTAELLSAFDGSLVLYQSGVDIAMNAVVASVFMVLVVLAIRFLGAWTMIWVLSWAARPVYRRFLPFGPNECGWCRFDQTGLPDHESCPECGRPWARRKRRHEWSRGVRNLCIAIVALTVVGVAISGVPAAIVRARYPGLTISEDGGMIVSAASGIGGQNSLNVAFSDGEGRKVYVAVSYDTEISLTHFGLLERLHSDLYLKPPWYQGATPIESRVGFIPRASVIAALERQRESHSP